MHSAPDRPLIAHGTLWVFLLSLGVGVVAQWPGLVNEFIANDDIRQQLFWMQRWVDPELYPETLLSRYSRAYVPWGVQSVYFAASHVVSPLFFSKLLPVLLLAVLCTAMFAMVRHEAGEASGWIAAGVCWASPLFLYNISGGLARGFAAPLMALFLLCWQRRRLRLLALTLLAQAVFIPYVFAVCALAAGLGFVVSFLSFHRENRRIFLDPVNGVLILVGVALVLLWRQQMAEYGFGPLAAGDTLLNAEFSRAGRFPIYPPASLGEELLNPFGFLLPFRDYGVIPGVIGAICLGALLVYGLTKRPRSLHWPGLGMPVLFLAASSLLLYTAARVVLLQLFIPSRYLSYSWELIVVLGLACLLGGALHRWTKGRPGVLMVAGVALCLAGIRGPGVALYDYTGGGALYAAVRALDKDSLVFGHPKTLDNVLTFGRRNVFATYELAHPWNTGYWSIYKERLEVGFRHYYSGDRDALVRFLGANHITHVVVDRRHFDLQRLREPDFFQPLDDYVRGLPRPGRYVLLTEKRFPVVWQDDRYTLYRVE